VLQLPLDVEVERIPDDSAGRAGESHLPSSARRTKVEIDGSQAAATDMILDREASRNGSCS